jgi:hypothetical protein
VAVQLNQNNSIGKPILVSISLKNGRNEDVYLNHVSEGSDFNLYLAGPDGKSVAWGDRGRQYLPRSLYEQLSNRVLTLHANQMISRKYDLTEYFKITCVGAYRLSIIRTVRGTASYPVAGCDLEVEVSSILFNVGS